MPVYNSQDYLSQAIESILGQTFSDFEFLIFDDGSSDNSSNICKQYELKDKRIKFKSFQHQGYSGLLNHGVKKAQGEFIARMDSDDIAMPERLMNQYEFLLNNTDHVAVGCQVIKIDPDGDPIGKMTLPQNHEEIDASQIYKGKGCILHPGSMIRTSTLQAIGGYRTEFEPGEDFDLFIRLAEYGKLHNLDGYLMRYRLHTKNVTATRKERHQHVKQKALEEAYKRRGLQEKVPEIQLIDTPESASENHFIWMHMALSAGFFKSARKHAWRGIKQSSFSKGDLYDLAQGMLGPITVIFKRWISK